jgi:hypothetical protein
MADIFIEDETLRQGFTQIPNAVLRLSDISPGAKLTYVMLLSYAWYNDSCYPGQDRLAADMGSGVRSVIRYLKELETAGLLTIKRRGLGHTNFYTLHRITRSANLADQEVPKTDIPEVPNLPTKNMHVKNSQNKKTKGTSKFRRALTPYIEDVAREFADEAPLGSTLTRVCRILDGAAVTDEDRAIDAIREARQVTKERTHAITKRSGKGSGVFEAKNKVPYFLAVLEDLVGPDKEGDMDTSGQPGRRAAGDHPG